MPGEAAPTLEKHKTLEDLWHSSAAAYLDSYKKFEGDSEYRKRQQESFIAGDIHNPVLDCPNLIEDELAAYETELLSLYFGIDEHTEESSVERIAYSRIIERKVEEVELLGQAHNTYYECPKTVIGKLQGSY